MNPLTPSAKTIQIYLPKGNPRGLRVAEMTTRMVCLIEIPRHNIDEFFVMPEAKKVGLYFLVGNANNVNKPLLYIGQTGELGKRLEQHHRNKDLWAWQRVFVMLLTNNALTQTHTLYMEHKAIARALEMGRYTLKNGNNGNRPHTPDPLKADCDEWFDTLNILLSTLGQPIFDSQGSHHHDKMVHSPLPVIDLKPISAITITPLALANPTNPSESMLFFCKTHGICAQGYYDNNRFMVLKGSFIRQQNTKTLKKSMVNKKQNLLNSGKLIIVDSTSYQLTEDQSFTSPSTAAELVTGRSSNGWKVWKNAAGQTLDSIYR